MVENYNNDGSVKFHISITLIDTCNKTPEKCAKQKS